MESKKRAYYIILSYIAILGPNEMKLVIDCSLTAAEIADETDEVIKYIKDYSI